jgi:hypothetical protein
MMNTNNNNVVLLLLAFLVAAVSAQEDPPPINACLDAQEGQQLTLFCDDPTHVITLIDFASYGQPEVCPTPALNTACHATTSLSVVQSQCIGQHGCSVAATNENFGDPCIGTVKRLAVQWTCGAPTDTVFCAQTDEFSPLNLACPTGHVISNAFPQTGTSYGTPSPVCPEPAVNATCHFENTTAVVADTCALRNACQLNATNEFFGFDPCVGTVKRLTVQYSCILVPAASALNAVVLLSTARSADGTVAGEMRVKQLSLPSPPPSGNETDTDAGTEMWCYDTDVQGKWVCVRSFVRWHLHRIYCSFCLCASGLL